ncbi:DUF6458 family protein [Actinoallomurus sp. NPDC050550]|uniref:DUF6458 family protein n=1 Tax=Actinoallomurus sp. NPDC050550 TaxID=3154937 RepID=UPI00340B0160
MPIGGGIALIVVGAILTFALTGSVRGIDLHMAGVILMLAGAAGLLLPLLVRTRRRSNRPAARSRQDVIDEGPQTLVAPPGQDPPLNDDRRTPDGRRPWQGP